MGNKITGTLPAMPPTTEHLILNFNKFDNIDSVNQLSEMTVLYAIGNNLENINASFGATLENLQLAGNRFKTYDIKWTENADNLKDLNLKRNPWVCDCDMVEFRNALETDEILQKKIQCQNIHGAPYIDDLSADMFCYEKPSTTSGSIIFKGGLVLALGIFLR